MWLAGINSRGAIAAPPQAPQAAWCFHPVPGSAARCPIVENALLCAVDPPRFSRVGRLTPHKGPQDSYRPSAPKVTKVCRLASKEPLHSEACRNGAAPHDDAPPAKALCNSLQRHRRQAHKPRAREELPAPVQVTAWIERPEEVPSVECKRQTVQRRTLARGPQIRSSDVTFGVRRSASIGDPGARFPVPGHPSAFDVRR